MQESEGETLDRTQVESIGEMKPLKRFRLGRYALMLLFAAVAAACVAPTVTSVAIAVDSSGESQVSLKRMTEGGSNAVDALIGYGSFLLIVALGVGLVAAATVAAVFCLADRTRPAGWTALAIVGIAGVAGALVALGLETSEIRLYLVFVATAFAALVAAALFELWRARWVRRQASAPAAFAILRPDSARS